MKVDMLSISLAGPQAQDFGFPPKTFSAARGSAYYYHPQTIVSRRLPSILGLQPPRNLVKEPPVGEETTRGEFQPPTVEDGSRNRPS